MEILHSKLIILQFFSTKLTKTVVNEFSFHSAKYKLFSCIDNYLIRESETIKIRNTVNAFSSKMTLYPKNLAIFEKPFRAKNTLVVGHLLDRKEISLIF